MRNLSKIFVSVLVAGALAFAGTPAKADSTAYVAAFYLSLKGIQSQAMKGTSNIWLALGSAEKAEQCNGLARDLDSGDLANKDGMKRFKAASDELVFTVSELEAAGVPLSAAQKAAADKASLQIAATSVLWVAAGVSAYKILSANDLNTFEKIALGIIFSAEVASAAKNTSNVMRAWKSYKSYGNAMKGFQPISKELSPQFKDL